MKDSGVDWLTRESRVVIGRAPARSKNPTWRRFPAALPSSLGCGAHGVGDDICFDTSPAGVGSRHSTRRRERRRPRARHRRVESARGRRAGSAAGSPVRSARGSRARGRDRRGGWTIVAGGVVVAGIRVGVTAGVPMSSSAATLAMGAGPPASARAVPGRASAAAASLGRRPAVSSAPPRRALALARARSGHGAGPPGEEDDRGTRLSANAPPSAFARARARGTARATPRALAHPEWADGADARGDDDANARGAGPGRPPDDRLLDAETAAAARDRSPRPETPSPRAPTRAPRTPARPTDFPRAPRPRPRPRARRRRRRRRPPPRGVGVVLGRLLRNGRLLLRNRCLLLRSGCLLLLLLRPIFG